MEDKKSPHKIKIETQLYWHQKNSRLTWKDIKHLQLEDDDVIEATWTDVHEADYGGYWHRQIFRYVEETDEQFAKRQKGLEQEKERMKKMRYETYLRLKKEFESD